MQIFEVFHEETKESVFCLGRTMTNETVAACLRVHPGEAFTVRLSDMSREEYEALPDYDGDCE